VGRVGRNRGYLTPHCTLWHGLDHPGELRVLAEPGIFPLDLLPLAPGLRRGVTAHIVPLRAQRGLSSFALPPLRGWFHAFDPQDRLDILALLASGIDRPGRWHGLTAEQPGAVIPETSLGSQRHENTMPPLPGGHAVGAGGATPAPFGCRIRVHGPRVIGVQAHQPQEAVCRPAAGVPWTDAEDAMVRTLRGAEVAQRTGRTIRAGYDRRHELKVPDGRRLNGRSVSSTRPSEQTHRQG
jgi:hypothetical protein